MINKEKLDELYALAKKVNGLAYNSQDPQALEDFNDAISPDIAVALIDEIKALRERNKELENALDVAMTYIDNATVIDDLDRESLSVAWAALNKDPL